MLLTGYARLTCKVQHKAARARFTRKKMKEMIAANWKMNKTVNEAISFMEALMEVDFKDREVLVCPPFTALSEVSGVISESDILLGAQNMHFEEKGAFTGEISYKMLKDVGVTHVLIGHSERRHVFNESNELINKKMKAALHHGLIPVFCVGETIEQRNANKTKEILKQQVTEGLNGIKDYSKIIMAYEPVWAIGTGVNATPEQADEAHAFIRSLIDVRILYGGSVKPDNIREIMKQKNVNGVLVGGASLEVDSFSQLIQQ